MNGVTSYPLIPINNDDNTCASASAKSSPMATPTAASRIPCRVIIFITSLRFAPSAMRMPTSRVRCETT